jgi:hypothetical protein
MQVVRLTAHYQVTPEGAGGAETSIMVNVIIGSRIDGAVVHSGMEAKERGPVKEKHGFSLSLRGVSAFTAFSPFGVSLPLGAFLSSFGVSLPFRAFPLPSGYLFPLGRSREHTKIAEQERVRKGEGIAELDTDQVPGGEDTFRVRGGRERGLQALDEVCLEVLLQLRLGGGEWDANGGEKGAVGGRPAGQVGGYPSC